MSIDKVKQNLQLQLKQVDTEIRKCESDKMRRIILSSRIDDLEQEFLDIFEKKVLEELFKNGYEYCNVDDLRKALVSPDLDSKIEELLEQRKEKERLLANVIEYENDIKSRNIMQEALEKNAKRVSRHYSSFPIEIKKSLTIPSFLLNPNFLPLPSPKFSLPPLRSSDLPRSSKDCATNLMLLASPKTSDKKIRSKRLYKCEKCPNYITKSGGQFRRHQKLHTEESKKYNGHTVFFF